MQFLTKRILTYLVIAIVVVNIDFLLPRIAPGTPAEILASGNTFPQATIKLVTERFGLNQPLSEQYFIFLKDLFATWPPFLGISFQYYPQTVTSLFFARLPWTLLLILSSLLLSVAISYVMAITVAQRRRSKIDVAFLDAAIASHSTPVFWSAMILIWVFGVSAHWFPVSGIVDPNASPGLLYSLSIVWHTVLPVVALTGSIFGETYILLRGSMQETLKSDFVLAARTRGLRDRLVASGYIVRNSLLPLVSNFSFSFAGLVSRAVLVEYVFGYAGIGDLLVDGVLNRDYPVLQGSFLLLTLIVILGGLIGDIALTRLDPRIKVS